MRGHVVVCGYGAKGKNAVRALLLKGHPTDGVVVVDTDPRALAEAAEAGFVTVAGSGDPHRGAHGGDGRARRATSRPASNPDVPPAAGVRHEVTGATPSERGHHR